MSDHERKTARIRADYDQLRALLTNLIADEAHTFDVAEASNEARAVAADTSRPPRERMDALARYVGYLSILLGDS